MTHVRGDIKGGIKMHRGKREDAKPIDETAEVIEPIEEVKTHTGVVYNCEKLNIRKSASKDSDVVAVVDAGSELLIDSKKSTYNFYKVCTASGIEGYCMSEFVKVDK